MKSTHCKNFLWIWLAVTRQNIYSLIIPEKKMETSLNWNKCNNELHRMNFSSGKKYENNEFEFSSFKTF